MENESGEPELLARLIQGDESALAQIFSNNVLQLERYARRMVGSPDIARDIVQDAFVALWEKRDTLNVRTTIKAYLFASVRGRALMALRAERHEAQHHEILNAGQDLPPGMGSPGNTTTKNVELAELRAAIADVLAALSPRIREVAELRWLDGLSYAEIAEASGTAIKTVENQLGSANRALKARLGPHWE